MDWNSIAAETFWVYYSRFLKLGTPNEVDLVTGTGQDLQHIELIKSAWKRDWRFTLKTVLFELEQYEKKPRHLVTAYALLCSAPDTELSSQARSRFLLTCDNAETLFQFLQAYTDYGVSARGRGFRRMLGSFYLNADPRWLSSEVAKCPEGYGWSHADVLKISRPWTDNSELLEVFHQIRNTDKSRSSYQTPAASTTSSPEPWSVAGNFDLLSVQLPETYRGSRLEDTFPYHKIQWWHHQQAILESHDPRQEVTLVVAAVPGTNASPFVDMASMRARINCRTVLILPAETSFADLSQTSFPHPKHVLLIRGITPRLGELISRFHNHTTLTPGVSL